jgi:hypothetical protein
LATKNPFKKGLEKIRDIRESFSDEIEEYAKVNAIYSPEEYKIANVDDFLKNYELSPLGEGLHARVYRLGNKKWIIKEAKWDLSMKFFGDAKLPLPAFLTQKVMSLFSFQFLPTKKYVQDDFKSYLEFAEYFGYFERSDTTSHPNRNLMLRAQKNIRDTLLFFKPELERKYNIKLNGKIEAILSSPKYKYQNFLPKEYQLFGESISKENKGKTTSYIFQEFVQGTLMADVPDKDLSLHHKKQLVLMIYLILLMHMQVGILPDTKPRNFMFNAHNWLTHTDNIIVAKDRLIFIDTRWFWNVKSNFIKRGLVIPNLMIQRAKYSLKELLNDIPEEKA